ncbi:TetR/AcrR family transcriptional regulator [Mycolicibacterium hodleri]|uniref:TetR/AcrR family transcriptional regulator n=1 Tax=Mycolicibacterium hodleri TaxID=49897 RepID=A0A502EJB7_9MYCO|nr:TetR/AcrR family transcriptional regulator [Mycolicibacterium hodleri]TPG36421.1 TetR/AcrR family transcriptional regulator [Mycolicibacterium hodleri]
MPVAPVRDERAQPAEIQFPRQLDLAGRRQEPHLAMLRYRTENGGPSRVVERILEAATQAVADNGFDGLSMDDIAVRAGCSRATVYRRMGGKEALRDAVLDEAIDRINASVAGSVVDLDGEERLVRAIVASLDTIRTDPVSAALLTGPATVGSVSSALITQVTDSIALLSGIDVDDGVGCELIARVTLSLLCWPGADSGTELAMIRRYVFGAG